MQASVVREVTVGHASREEVRAERPGGQKEWRAKEEKGVREQSAMVKSHSLYVKKHSVNLKMKKRKKKKEVRQRDNDGNFVLMTRFFFEEIINKKLSFKNKDESSEVT